MPTPTVTHTSTYNVVNYADPYKQCVRCCGWIDGALDKPGPLVLVPCHHESDYRDVCPSWSPVDGCTCTKYGISHPMRPPANDGKKY